MELWGVEQAPAWKIKPHRDYKIRAQVQGRFCLDVRVLSHELRLLRAFCFKTGITFVEHQVLLVIAICSAFDELHQTLPASDLYIQV